MKKFFNSALLFVIVGLFVFVQAGKVSADGTETLGAPSVTIEPGSGIVAAGTGLETQPGTIDINVPGSVVQALLYWSGGSIAPAPGDDTIIVSQGAISESIIGTLIGGPTLFFGSTQFSCYRADITDSGLVSPGANSLTVSDMDFGTTENNGAGILVIYDDGVMSADIEIRDGLDLAFFQFAPKLDATVEQTFIFSPAATDRTATLAMFFGSVSVDGLRPNEITIDFNVGADISLIDALGSNDGPQWDTISEFITIPSNASTMTLQAVSTPTFDPLGASFSWNAGALSLPLPSEPPDGAFGCRVTGGGNDTYGENEYTFGGQAGANTGQQPQPKGEWTHHQKKGPCGSFVFHAGTASAPEGTEIDLIECSDAGYCFPAREAPAKQIDFEGVGTFKNIKNIKNISNNHSDTLNCVIEDNSLHWFEVHIEDLGEPGKNGRQPDSVSCPEGGSDGVTANCDCADYYRITIYAGETSASGVIYTVEGYIDGGNLQIHPPTGFDLK